MKFYVVTDPPFEGKPPYRGDIVQTGTHNMIMFDSNREHCAAAVGKHISEYAIPASEADWEDKDGNPVQYKTTKKFLKNHKPVL